MSETTDISPRHSGVSIAPLDSAGFEIFNTWAQLGLALAYAQGINRCQKLGISMNQTVGKTSHQSELNQ